MARFTVDAWNSRINGTEDDDQISGDWRSNTLDGNEGDDTIYGYGDNDYIYGASGNDYLNGGEGDDYISGGSGADTIVDLWGVDRILGGSGNDDIRVRGGDWFRYDNVEGGDGNDTLRLTDQHIIAYGGAGNDTIYTDLAEETFLVGGTGSDRFVVTDFAYFTDLTPGGGRVAQIHGGEGTVSYGIVGGMHVNAQLNLSNDSNVDTLDLSNAEVTWDGGSGFDLTVDLQDGLVHNLGSTNGSSVFAQVTGIENVVGTSANDEIIGNAADNRLEGGAGDDYIEGGQDQDTLLGGAGEDELHGGTNTDSLQGGDNDDELYGDGGSDVLEGGAGNDTLEGGGDWDTLSGDAGRDTLRGDGGDDWLYGDLEPGAVYADTLTGGVGADHFVFTDVGKALTFNIKTGQFASTYITDTITDFDAFGSDHDWFDVSNILTSRSDFDFIPGQDNMQRAMDQGYIYFVQGPVGARLMVDLNGSIDGTHTDTAYVYAVADLQGVALQDVTGRAELFY